ncbi:MAG: hypothetical protein QXX08_02540 [Candidatus Bathyarchaeia archaeon]
MSHIGSADDLLNESLSLLKESLDHIDGEVSLRTFDPSLDRFINDEESIKGDEMAEETTLTLDRVQLPRSIELHDGSLRHIFAVDTSSIVLGECGKGLVFAVRGIIVHWNPWNQKSIVVQKFEAPCFVSNENKKHLYNSLRKKLLGLSEVEHAPDLLKMVDRVRNIHERYLQMQAAEKYPDSILLFDGSLTGGTIDTPVNVLRNILQSASASNSDVVAFSKKTRLVTKWGERILDLLANEPTSPIIMPVKNIVETSGTHEFLGEVYMARLGRVPVSFRLDVYSQRNHGQVLADLLHSVYLENGYPKPLIEAHVFCYFNPFDALTYQGLLAKNGLVLRHEFDVRRILFGVYGGT